MNYKENVAKMASALSYYGPNYVICEECGEIVQEGWCCQNCGNENTSDGMTLEDWLDDEGIETSY